MSVIPLEVEYPEAGDAVKRWMGNGRVHAVIKPTETLLIFRNGRRKLVSEKVGRNDACPCGSGAKAKRCCK